MTDLVPYTSDDGQARARLRVDGDTLWLISLEIAELFQTTKQNASLHAKNIFSDGELAPDAVVKQSLATAADGKSYEHDRIQHADVIELCHLTGSQASKLLRQLRDDNELLAHGEGRGRFCTAAGE